MFGLPDWMKTAATRIASLATVPERGHDGYGYRAPAWLHTSSAPANERKNNYKKLVQRMDKRAILREESRPKIYQQNINYPFIERFFVILILQSAL
jgi:hypothetical protein